MQYNSAIDLIGNTPLLKLNRVFKQEQANVYVKLEMFNAAGSVKDRVALRMIEAAEQSGELKPGQTILECTSGNTGVGLAMVGALKGYPVIIVMSKKASRERQQLISAYGGQVILSSSPGGIAEDVDRYGQIAKDKGYFFMSQFWNRENPRSHYESTGPEIVKDLGQAPDALFAGVGTGGTLTGTGSYLKECNPSCQVYAIEPSEAAVLLGGEDGEHQISGIGVSILPGILDQSLIDKELTVNSETAIDWVKRLAQEEGLFLGASSAAAIAAVDQVIDQFETDQNLVVICPDSGERYLSMELLPNHVMDDQ